MGLDIYLHHVSKPNIPSDTILTDEFCEENNLIRFSKKEYDDLPTTIKDRCVITKMKAQYYNLRKILTSKGYKSSADISIVGWGSGSVSFSVRDGQKKSEIFELTTEELEKNYIFEQINRVYVVTMEEIDYQRKGLNDLGWSLLPGNCEYCDDKSVVQKLCDKGGLSETFIQNWIDGETIFYAWW